MANYVSNFTLKLKTEGVKNAADESAQINKNMQSAAAAADKLATKMPKAYAASRASGSSRAVSSSQEAEEISGYGRARGAIGTGAASRDFANQAQGLGGLVRLYATFAANIFAAGAAFRALSTAMDTTNMVKGLDQLGAASGRNLGTLSKDLAAASDGAVSLREAMEATAKASSAGLSNTQILQMGDAARKASQALGISMPDALSRISRGISKLEPELLDELGLFVKIDDATQAYARSVGKSASSLTDFERRQAFANAVLDQAQQKFGNINIDVNPYNKLLASFQNLLQSGLELVNKVLGPIAKILSESPTALAIALGAIGITLLKQVSPVFTEWRQNLRNAAADAAESAKRIQESFGDEFQSRLEARFRIPDLQRSIKDTEAQLAKLNKTASEPGAAPGSLLKRAPTVSTVEADEKSLNSLQKLQTTREKYLRDHEQGTKRLSATQIQNTKTEIAWLEKKQVTLRKEIEQTRLATELAQKRALLDEAFGKAQAVADKPPGRFDPETIAIMQTEKARRKYDQVSAVSNAAETSRILGVKAAWGALREEIEDKNIKGFAKYSTLAKGGLAAIGTRVVGIISSFASLGPQIVLAFTAFEIVNSFLSKNKKEADEAAASLTRLNESAKFVDQVLLDISTRDPLAQLSTESIKARATALQEISTAMQDTMKKITAQVATANWWDVFMDGMVASLTFGAKGLLADSSKQISFSVSQAFKTIGDSAKKSEAIKQFKESFKVDPTDRKALEEVLAESPEKFMEMAPEVTEFMKKLGIEISNTASKGAELTNAFSAVEKTLKDFVTSSLPTDPISKFGTELITLGDKMGGALGNADTAVAALVETLNSPSRLSLLGNIGVQLNENKDQLLQAARLVQVYKNSLEGLDQQTSYFQSQVDRAKVKNKDADTSGLEAQIAGINKIKTEVRAAINEQKKVIDQGTKLMGDAAQQSIKIGVDYMTKAVGIAFARAAITLSNAFAERLGDTEAGIMRRAELEKRGNDLQIAQLQAQKGMLGMQEELQKSNALLTNAIDINTAAQEKANLIAENKPTKEADEKMAGLVQDRLKILSGEQSEGQNKLLKLARDNLDAQIAQLRNVNKSIDIKAFDQSAAARLKIEQDTRDVERERLTTNKQQFEESIKLLPFLNAEALARKKELEDGLLRLKQLDEQTSIQAEIAKNQDTLTRKGATTQDRQAASEALTKLYEAQERQRLKQEEERKRSEQGFSEYLKNNANKAAQYSIEQDKIVYNTRKTQEETAQALKEQGFETDKILGISTAAEIAKAEMQKAKEVEQFRLKQSTDRLKQEKAAALLPIQQRIDSTTGKDQELAKADKARVEALYDAQILGENAVSDAKQRNIELTGIQAVEQAKLNSLTSGLRDVFGELGSAIGGFIEALMGASSAQQALNDQIAAQREIIKREDIDPKERQAAIDKEADLRKKAGKVELDNNIKIIGATKKLFSEKTAAHKALGAIEKVMHLKRLWMDNQELISTIKTNALALADHIKTAMAGAQADVPGIFAKFSAMMGPWGWAAAAAVVAALGLRGKSASPPKGFTAEEQQKVQGTGQIYRNGELVNLQGGTLGDATAQSKTISNGITNLEKYSFENLEYSNKMLDALKSIEKNTQNFVTGIIKAIPGINIKPETIKGGNWLTGKSSTEVLDQGIKIIGTVGQIIDKQAQLIEYTNTKVTKGGFLGIIGGGTKYKTTEDVLGEEATRNLSRSLSQIFSSFGTALSTAGEQLGLSTASEIITAFEALDLSEILKASFMDMDPSEMAESFESILSAALDEATFAIFPQLEEFWQAGETFGDTVIRLASDSRALNLSLESAGMFMSKAAETMGQAASPEQIERLNRAQTEYDRLVSTRGDLATSGVTESDWGSSTYSTMQDLADANQRLTDALTELESAQRSVNITTQYSTVNNIRLQQSLIDAAGGLENFIEQNEFFADNFLTEAERLAPVQRRLVAELDSLGLSSIDTMDEFKNLVQSLDLAKTSDAALYQSLMDLAPAFVAVYGAVDKANSTVSLEIQLLEAQGYAYEALLMKREEERKSLSDAELAIKEQIWAQEDLNRTNNLNLQLLDAQGRSAEALNLRRQQELKALSDADKIIQKRIWAEQDAAKKSDIVTDIAVRTLRAQGDETGASMLQLSIQRRKERHEVEQLDSSLLPLLDRLYDLEDLANAAAKALEISNAEDGLTVRILRAQGKETEALNIERAKERAEYAKLSPTLANLFDQLVLLEDAATASAKALEITNAQDDLNLRILRAQGNETAALTIERAKERAEYAKLSPTLADLFDQLVLLEDAAISASKALEITNAEDDLRIRIMRAQGNEMGALNLERARERAEYEKLGPTVVAFYDQLIKIEDAAAAATKAMEVKNAQDDVMVRILRAQGNETAALAIERAREVAQMKAIDPSLETMLYQLYSLEDAALAVAKAAEIESARQSLYVRILRAQGNETAALAIERAKERAELAKLDPSLVQFLDQLYSLEDAAKAAAKAAETHSKALDMQIRIQELLGNSVEAVRLRREKELETLDEQLKPAQRYIWALEDEASLKDKARESYNKLRTSIKDTISSLKSSIETLKEYQKSLITGDKSPLSPAQKYAQLKQQAADVAAIATGIAVTDAEKEAKAKAIEQLPGVSDALLDMSRTLFASSDAYIKDYTWIQGILNQTISSAEVQLTEAEKQLRELETQSGYLGTIEENTSDTNVLLAQFGQYLRDYTDALASVAITRAAYTSTIPGYASGGLASGLSIVGEQGPELVDFNSPGRVYPAQQTAQILRQENLLEELRELRKEVAQLREDQNVQTGHLIQSNYDANARAATQIVESNNNLVKQQSWDSKSKAVVR